MWSVQLAVSSFHDHVCLVLFQLSNVQKTCSSQHRHWSLQSRVPGCYLSGLYIFFTFTVVPYEQQTTTDSSSEDEKKRLSVLFLCLHLCHLSFFNLFIMDFLMQHTKGFLLIKAQSDFFVKGFSWCPFAPSPYHSLEYFLPLPSCTSIKVQCLEISCSYVACWGHSSEIAFMNTV